MERFLGALIYLDTSTIVTLERALKASPRRFDTFADFWHSSGCTLAISTIHVFELSGSKHADSRERRLQVLARLGPARTDINPNAKALMSLRQLDGREICAVLAGLIGREELLGSGNGNWVGFPMTLPAPQVHQVLRWLTTGQLRRKYRQMREAFELEARARSRPTGTKFEKSRLRDLPSGPLTAQQTREALISLRALLRSEEWQREVLSSLPASMRKEAEAALIVWVEDLWTRMTVVGPREAFADVVGAQLDADLKRFTHDLVVQHVFRDKVQQVLQELGGQNVGTQIKQWSRMIKLEDCPGTWLRHAVDFELQNARASWEAGATYDLLHLAHLPYVDVLIADAEITENTKKVFRRKNFPPRLASVHPPIAVAGSIEALQAALEDAFERPPLMQAS